MNTRRRTGFAMLAALMLMALLAIIAIAVLSMSAADRRRAVRHTRSEYREGCAYSGMTYARAYFANNFASWNTFLADPANYNPLTLPSTNGGWGAQASANLTDAGIVAIRDTGARPQLFVDLDGDGRSDAYIFIRDNYDEFPPAAANFKQDNDQNAIVGAVCISQSMAPRREDGTVDEDRLMVESLLSYNQAGGGYDSQSGGGADGTGNRNK